MCLKTRDCKKGVGSSEDLGVWNVHNKITISAAIELIVETLGLIILNMCEPLLINYSNFVQRASKITLVS